MTPFTFDRAIYYLYQIGTFIGHDPADHSKFDTNKRNLEIKYANSSNTRIIVDIHFHNPDEPCITEAERITPDVNGIAKLDNIIGEIRSFAKEISKANRANMDDSSRERYTYKIPRRLDRDLKQRIMTATNAAAEIAANSGGLARGDILPQSTVAVGSSYSALTCHAYEATGSGAALSQAELEHLPEVTTPSTSDESKTGEKPAPKKTG